MSSKTPKRGLLGAAKLALMPVATMGKFDTGLRFTDILFGFVIRELFVRLQHWGTLPSYVRWQLIVGAVLVLGSWIGFRRSLNRAQYEVKFFNVPFARFVLDQAMILLYFRVATLTPNTPRPSVDPNQLGQATIKALLWVFLLYLAWDIGALWMGSSSKYAESHRDWYGFAITFVFTALVGGLCWGTIDRQLLGSGAEKRFWVAICLLIAYRWVKDVRTSLRDGGAVAVSAAPTGT